MLLEQRQRMLQELSALQNYGAKTPVTPVAQKPYNSGSQHIEQSNGGACHRSQTETRTTIILRNLPNGFSRDMVADLLILHGFKNKFDFIYTPVKFSVMSTTGYAFVNFVSYEAADECILRLNGFSDFSAWNMWNMSCETRLNVYWSEKDQGLTTIIDRHRNSPVMHNSVRDEFKPAIYADGKRVAFPPPTKHIRPPRMQRYNKNPSNMDGDEELEAFMEAPIQEEDEEYLLHPTLEYLQ